MSTNNRFKKFLEKCVEKWPAKIICLILAIALYLLHQSSLLEKRALVVPVTVVQNGNVCLVGDAPQSVTVIVKAAKDVVSLIKNTDISANINLTQLTDTGTFSVPVNINLSEQVKAYDPFEISVKPERLEVNVEKIKMKYVPVAASTAGSVSHGYVIESIAVDPPFVSVTGPESIVDVTNEIQTTLVDVSNANTNFTVEVDSYMPNNLVELEDKGPYKVSVFLTTEFGEKVFKNINVYTINLNENLIVSSSIPKVQVKLAGTVPYLEKYTLPQSYVIADFSKIDSAGTYEIPLKYSSNSNVQILEKSADFITVSFAYKNPDIENAETAKRNIKENQEDITETATGDDDENNSPEESADTEEKVDSDAAETQEYSFNEIFSRLGGFGV